VIIQVLLIAAFAVIALAAARSGPSATHLAYRRVLAVLLLLAAAVAVLFPSILQWMANLVGVDRGTDLLLYVFVVVSVVVWLRLYRRTAVTDARIVELTRALALSDERPAGPLGRRS
jgi:hypothetical protein